MPKLSLNASKKTKHSPAGEIPVDWGWGPAKHLVQSVQSGTSLSGEDREPQGNEIALLKVSAVTSGKFLPTEAKAVAQDQSSRLRLPVRKGQILVNRANGSARLVGTAVYVDQDCSNTYLPDKLWSVTHNPSTASDRFLAFILSWEDFLKQVHERSSGGTGMRNISSKAYLQIPVPLPPLPEQRRIAEILGTWDRAIETLESLIAAKERRKQALMEQLLSGRKRLPGFTGKWPNTHLGKLAENVSVRNNGKLGWDRLYAVTKANGMIPMREQVMGISTNNCKLVRHDDFAYNPMRLNIGSLARWQSDEDVMVSGDYIVFRCNEGELDPRYFDHLRRSEHWNQFVNVGGSGSVRVRRYFKDIAPFQIRCPSFKEQQAIAAVLDTADRELTLHRQHLATLRTQKRGLMKLLLTGAVRVKP